MCKAGRKRWRDLRLSWKHSVWPLHLRFPPKEAAVSSSFLFSSGLLSSSPSRCGKCIVQTACGWAVGTAESEGVVWCRARQSRSGFTCSLRCVLSWQTVEWEESGCPCAHTYDSWSTCGGGGGDKCQIQKRVGNKNDTGSQEARHPHIHKKQATSSLANFS